MISIIPPPPDQQNFHSSRSLSSPDVSRITGTIWVNAVGSAVLPGNTRTAADRSGR